MENKEGFLTKVKNGLSKFFKGIKNFAVKTGRVNSTNCYGCIDNIGDLIVYDDHALISAVGMDDVKFTHENVVSYAFEGLGRIRKNRATVKYRIQLDDKVVFPEKVREKQDVRNLTAIVFIDRVRSSSLGNGLLELKPCDVFSFQDTLVIVLNLERRVGDKMEKYQESVLYPYSNVVKIEEIKDKTLLVNFNDGKQLRVTPRNEDAAKKIKEILKAE